MSVQEKFQTFIDAFLNKITTDLGDQIMEVIVFGSVSRGQATNDSDFDLLVEINLKIIDPAPAEQACL